VNSLHFAGVSKLLDPVKIVEALSAQRTSGRGCFRRGTGKTDPYRRIVPLQTVKPSGAVCHDILQFSARVFAIVADPGWRWPGGRLLRVHGKP
jgi:hypothetical protein